MTKHLPSARIGASFAMALALASTALSGVARADDDYNTGHETIIRQAAMSAHAAVAGTPSSVSAQNDNFGAPGQEAVIDRAAASRQTAPVNVARAKGTMGDYASDGSSQPLDILGVGGHQDALAREIFHPGTTVGF